MYFGYDIVKVYSQNKEIHSVCDPPALQFGILRIFPRIMIGLQFAIEHASKCNIIILALKIHISKEVKDALDNLTGYEIEDRGLTEIKVILIFPKHMQGIF